MGCLAIVLSKPVYECVRCTIVTFIFAASTKIKHICLIMTMDNSSPGYFSLKWIPITTATTIANKDQRYNNNKHSTQDQRSRYYTHQSIMCCHNKSFITNGIFFIHTRTMLKPKTYSNYDKTDAMSQMTRRKILIKLLFKKNIQERYKYWSGKKICTSLNEQWTSLCRSMISFCYWMFKNKWCFLNWRRQRENVNALFQQGSNTWLSLMEIVHWHRNNRFMMFNICKIKWIVNINHGVWSFCTCVCASFVYDRSYFARGEQMNSGIPLYKNCYKELKWHINMYLNHSKVAAMLNVCNLSTTVRQSIHSLLCHTVKKAIRRG